MIMKLFSKIKALEYVALIALIASLLWPSHIGLFFAIACGMAIGSYATTAVARLPSGTLFKRHDPFCASCKKLLAPRDLFPIFSYLVNLGRCRFCNKRIPMQLFIVESTVTTIFVFSYLWFGFGLAYISLSLTCSFVVVLLFSYPRAFS